MKKICSIIFIAVCILLPVSRGEAQTSTYILLRHAEKDTMKIDPPLTREGEQRSHRLVEVLKAYTPDAIYSTNFARTKATVMPIAKKFNKDILIYDPRNLPAMAELLLAEKGKTIIVAGHSNTTPALVNLLIKENTYKDLDESVYNQLWIVTVTADGRAAARVVTY